MEKQNSNYGIPILKDYDKHINTLESEAEGTPSKKGEFPKRVKEVSASPLPFNYKKWLVVSIIFLLILAIAFILLSTKDGQRCMSNPFIYGADQVSSKESGEIYCSCNFLNPRYAPFYFNNHNLSIGVP